MTFDEAIHIIETEDTGEEVITAIVVALQSLADGAMFEIDISDEVTIIRDNVSGSKVKKAIHDALAKISAAVIREYVVTFEWCATIEEYRNLETHDSEVLYAIGGTEGTVSSYEQVFKGDVELHKVMRGSIEIWSKPEAPDTFDETTVSIVELRASDKSRIGVVYTSDDMEDIEAYLRDQSHAANVYEVYYGHDWMAIQTGIVPSVLQAIDTLCIVTLPNNTMAIPTGYLYNNQYLVKCDLTNTTLTSIPGGAFYQCVNLQDVGTIPRTVSVIDSGAFGGSRGNVISNLTVADGDTPLSINNGAFSNMTSIVQMGIPSRTTSIAAQAFQNCHITSMIIAKEEGSLDGYPWGATSIDNIWWMGDPDES